LHLPSFAATDTSGADDGADPATLLRRAGFGSLGASRLRTASDLISARRLIASFHCNLLKWFGVWQAAVAIMSLRNQIACERVAAR